MTTVKFGLFSYLDLVSDYYGCLEEVQDNGKPVTAAILEQINGEGYVGVVSGVRPGTEYYAVVYASNGYAETIDLYGPATTLGDPLPIYQNFKAADYDPEYELESAADWLGTWNYYAVDYYGSTGLREYLGQVKITASETETEGPDADGFYDEYVLVDGLFPNAVVDGPTYGYEVGDCVLEMDVYAGAMYSFAATTYDGKSTVATYSKANNAFYSGVRYYSAFIPVADGYYALVDLAESAYDFTGLRVVQTYVWDAFYDMLLIDPEKDDNGLAPKEIGGARKLIKDIAAQRANLVETEKGRIHSILDQYKKSVKASGVLSGLKGDVCPMNKAVVKSVKYVGPAGASVQESAPAVKTRAPREL